MISPAMSTFQYPPSPPIMPQHTSSTSRAETILDHVPSSPLTASFKAGSAVFCESKHPRIAYREDAIGVKTVESSAGDGSVLIKMVWRVEIQSTVLSWLCSGISSWGGSSVTLAKGWWIHGSKMLKLSSLFFDSSASRREIENAAARR